MSFSKPAATTALTGFAALLISSIACGEIYRWVDENGRTHYGDRPTDAEQVKDITDDIKQQNVYQSELAASAVDQFKHGRVITKYMPRSEHQTPVPFTVYSLQKPLLPDGRLLTMVARKNSLWFASDNGLYEFDRGKEQWYLHNKSTGLPGTIVYDVALDGDRLFIKMYDKVSSVLRNERHYAYDVDHNQYHESKKTIGQIRAGGKFTTKNSDIFDNWLFDVLHYDDKVWITGASNLGQGTDKWKGGVSALKPLTKRGRMYTTRDGLAHDYCYGITASENNSVWVTHWEADRGLSMLEKNSHEWKNIKKSRNGVELGGVQIAAVNDYIIIGQQRALVIYDKQSQLAFEMDESTGLPGYIVSDIVVDDTYIWASVYGMRSSGKYSNSGLVKIAIAEVDTLFRKMLEEERSLGNEQQTSADSLLQAHRNSEVISHKIAYDSPKRIGIDVTYYYSGKKGDAAWLSGITLANGKSTGFWAHRPLRMEKGTHTGRISIELNDKAAPEVHCTDGVLFEMYTQTISTFYSTKVAYDKCWHKNPPTP